MTQSPTPTPDGTSTSTRAERADHLLDTAWGVIANAGMKTGSGWDSEHPEWVQAATRWRENYHAYLGLELRPVPSVDEITEQQTRRRAEADAGVRAALAAPAAPPRPDIAAPPADLDTYKASVREEIARHGGDPATAVGLVVGAASSCWSNLGDAGVFESERASALVDVLLEYVAPAAGLSVGPLPMIRPAVDQADSAVSAVKLDVLCAYLNIAAAAGERARVDWSPTGDVWEPAGVVKPVEPDDPALKPDRVVIELDRDGRQLAVSLLELRPHRPCHGSGPDREHPAGDSRFCQPGHADTDPAADLTGAAQ